MWNLLKVHEKMDSSSHLWQTAGAAGVDVTYGDSMLFLKCVTDKGGSERTKTFKFSISSVKYYE